MPDEKTQAQPGDKKQDKPPAPVQQQAPKDQHTGPARAADHKQLAGPTPANDQHKATPAAQTAAGQTAAMQQSVGNQQVNRAMRAAREPGKDPHPPGMKVSHPEDAAEKEAEAVAKKVTGDQPAHPHDHPGPAPGDPSKVVGDPSKVHGDPDVVHRAVANHIQPAKPQPAPAHPATPAPQHPAPARPSPTSVLDHPGPGQPIPQPTRGTLEAKLKADLGHVVVHHDAASDKAVRALQAIAVTRGNHIFLASDASPNDLSLMAHEVTHVLQHNDDTVHRQTDGTAAATKYESKKPPMGVIDTGTKKTLNFTTLLIPQWKKELPVLAPIKWRPANGQPENRRPDDQREIWLKDPTLHGQAKKGVQDYVDNTLKLGSSPYYLQGPAPKTGKSDFLYVGSAEDIGSAILIPPWDKNPTFHLWQVDHMQEWQLNGPNIIDNLQLLDSSLNQSYGSTIDKRIRNQITEFLSLAKGDKASPLANPPDINDIEASYEVTFGGLTGDGTADPDPAKYWKRGEIGKPEHVRGLEPLPVNRLTDVKGQPNRLVIYQRAGGGRVLQRIPVKNGVPDISEWNWTTRNKFIYTVTSFQWYPKSQSPGSGKVGEISGEVTNSKLQKAPMKAYIMGMNGVPYGGFLDTDSLYSNKIKANFASPVDFASLDLDPDKGLVGRGVIPKPSIKLLQNVQIAIILDGRDVGVEADITASQLKLPEPFKVKGGALALTAKPSGLSVAGRIDFEIKGLATGFIGASATTAQGGGFALEGSLDFDKTLFQPATLTFNYAKVGADYQWGVGGTLGIPPNKVPGVQQATINASYANGTFTASGDATLNVPGLQSGSLMITYGQRDGLTMGGTFGLAPNPVIESGTVSATVSKRPPRNQWQLSASGTVKPKIPGVDTTLSASYENGVFTVEGSVAYARGMLSGSLTVGLTNRALDPKGQPSGAPHAGAPLRPYGGGTVTARITPWLQGTVGVQLQADGSVQLMGEIALPASVDLFKAMQVQKNLLNIGMDIPIVGVAVMGQRIGIFATIQGGLDASASIGPGQLRQLSLRVQYNPEHEDRTQITGGAQLFIPAQAGLRLYVRGALGAGIPVVSAEAGLEIGGKLGVEGAVQAGVTVNWTPKQGLVIDAQASLSAEPSFTFDINGYVKVGADLVVTSVTLYEKHWELASFRYGSGLRVGVRAPIHYEQGKPFTFSLSDVQFDLPKIDPKKVLTDLVHQIA